tara:strand:- start:195 stop:362 length:168 start_codon:yes stop_codon:yes gene_type:complete
MEMSQTEIRYMILRIDVDLEILYGMNQTESVKESIQKKQKLKLALRRYLYGEDAV